MMPLVDHRDQREIFKTEISILDPIFILGLDIECLLQRFGRPARKLPR
jgi:hypothetical protein